MCLIPKMSEISNGKRSVTGFSFMGVDLNNLSGVGQRQMKLPGQTQFPTIGAQGFSIGNATKDPTLQVFK